MNELTPAEGESSAKQQASGGRRPSSCSPSSFPATPLSAALEFADSGESTRGIMTHEALKTLALEYRKVHAALVRLDGIYRHDLDNTGFRPDWMREALSPENVSAVAPPTRDSALPKDVPGG